MNVPAEFRDTPERQAIYELVQVVDVFTTHWREQRPFNAPELLAAYDSYAFARKVIGLPDLREEADR